MELRTKLIFVSLVSLCGACDLSLRELFIPSPYEVNSGPLSSDEIQAFASHMQKSMGDKVAECLSKEATIRALKLGDPETLDPAEVELLPADQWSALDKPGKRIILTQVVFNQAIPFCTQVKG